jgi:DNA-binding transcriptional LysR family regulator
VRWGGARAAHHAPIHGDRGGPSLYRRIKPALADIADARQEAVDNRHDFSGLIRIGAPVQLASAHVTPAICDFMERHPRIEVELKPSDREVDVFDDELDVAIRIRNLADSGLKVRRLGGDSRGRIRCAGLLLAQRPAATSR